MLRNMPRGMTPVPPGVSVPSVSRAKLALGAHPLDRALGRAVIAGRADFDGEARGVDHLVEIVVAHRDRPAADMRGDVGLEPRQDIVAAHLREAGARHAAGVDLGADAAGAAPLLIAQRLVLVGGERKEDELGADRLRRGEPVEMLLLHAGNEDHRAGIDLGAAPADAAGGGGGHHRERGHEIGREIFVVEARHVQLAGRDHGGGAAVHVIADPADGVLRRRPLAEHRMDMAVDQARHDGAAAGVEHGVGLGIGGRIERRDLRAVDQQRRHRGLRLARCRR